MVYKQINGFTLAETIITVGLTALIVGGMFSIFLIEQQALYLRASRGDDMRQGQTALRRIEDTIRQGQLVVSSATISGTAYTTDLHTLILDIPAINAAGGNISGVTDRVVYTLNGTDLKEVSLPGTGSVRPSGIFTLAQHVSSFTVQTNGDPLNNTTQVILYVGFIPPAPEATPVEGQVRATLRNI